MDPQDLMIEVMLSRALKGKAPATWQPADWWRYHKSFRQTRLRPRELAIEIYRGHSFAPIYTPPQRIEQNFLAAWHIAFDFDTGDEASDLERLMRPGTFCDYYASFGYSTPSSTPAAPRSRVVFVFDEPITDSRDARVLYQVIAGYIAADGGICDPQCSDPLRLYFGSEGCIVKPNWTLLTHTAVQALLAQAPYEPPAAPQRRATQPALASSLHGTPTPEYVDRRVSRLLASLAAAAPGDRHRSRRDLGRTMGGFVAAGYIGYDEALRRLVEAAPTSTPAKAAKELKEALEYGLNQPLPIDVPPALSEVL